VYVCVCFGVCDTHTYTHTQTHTHQFLFNNMMMQ